MPTICELRTNANIKKCDLEAVSSNGRASTFAKWQDSVILKLAFCGRLKLFGLWPGKTSVKPDLHYEQPNPKGSGGRILTKDF